MEPFTVVASTFASRRAGSSAVSEPLIVLAETPPVSPKASIRTRTSPFTSSTLTGPLAVTTSTSPLTTCTSRGATRSRHVHVAHRGRGAQARIARQPHDEVHGDVVMAFPSYPDFTVPGAAIAVAPPFRAHGNAALVRYGDETHARGVRRPVRSHRGDLQRITLGRLHRHRATGVPDPHPLFRTELGPVRPWRSREATGPTLVPGELAPQVAQRSEEHTSELQ